jgi:hypothetical protein
VTPFFFPQFCQRSLTHRKCEWSVRNISASLTTG